MAHLIQLVSDPQARSLSDYLTRLWSRKEKRVDGHLIPAGPNHLCEVWWMVRDVAVDGWNWLREGVQELPPLMWSIFCKAGFAVLVLLASTIVARLIWIFTRG